jgi:D-sedoheptulose 7-phosphate isomerase
MSATNSLRDSILHHIDAVTAALETQTPVVAAAALRLSRCLLDESRIFCCGTAGSSALAQHFTSKLMGKLERERPGLPVFCLSDSASLHATLSEHFGQHDVYARQLRALGQPGDVLVIIAASAATVVVQSIIAAHDRGMDVLVLCASDNEELRQVLREGEGDFEICVACESPLRAEEVQLLLLNLLSEQIERELFGDMQ